MTEEYNDYFEDEGLPLFPGDGGCDAGEGDFVYDEDGSFLAADTTLTAVSPATTVTIPGLPVEPISLERPCSLKALNGSWLIHFTPRSPSLFQQIRGPMRLEAQGGVLRVSGDIYVKTMTFRALGTFPGVTTTTTAFPATHLEPFSPGSLVINKNWYPTYPNSQYRWYFRSTGCRYIRKTTKGVLVVRFRRHLWNGASQEFTSDDAGWLVLNCTTSLFTHATLLQPTLKMTGTAFIGGQWYDVTATKTSPYYRGCQVEVDVMVNRSWPGSVQKCGEGPNYSFTSVYRSDGLDFYSVVNQVNIPEDASLTKAELHNLLTTYRTLSPTNKWRLWLLVGSRYAPADWFGIMFDTDNPPHREGAVGFYDPTFSNMWYNLPSIRGEKLGDVPIAFLRTLIHEAGHAFNLYHPKADVHTPAIGTTIMNQTGDVMGFATTGNLYPCNATMAFMDHNRTSLIHSPDPQVKPGWKPFGWGHGSAWSGLAEPVDAAGLDPGEPASDEVNLGLELPAEVYRGEFIKAKVTVSNDGDQPQDVTTAINLSEHQLRMNVTDPAGKSEGVRDVVLACGERRMTTLDPGQSIERNLQLFYTNKGFKFDQPGRYVVQAELDIGDGTIAYSKAVEIMVRPAMTDQEVAVQDLSMSDDVGISLALGDFGADKEAQEKLSTMAEQYGDTEMGGAAAILLANSLARSFRDPMAQRVVRRMDKSASERYLEIALKDRKAVDVARLATATISTTETDSPIIAKVQSHIKDAPRGAYRKAERDEAAKIFADYEM